MLERQVGNFEVPFDPCVGEIEVMELSEVLQGIDVPETAVWERSRWRSCRTSRRA